MYKINKKLLITILTLATTLGHGVEGYTQGCFHLGKALGYAATTVAGWLVVANSQCLCCGVAAAPFAVGTSGAAVKECALGCSECGSAANSDCARARFDCIACRDCELVVTENSQPSSPGVSNSGSTLGQLSATQDGEVFNI